MKAKKKVVWKFEEADFETESRKTADPDQDRGYDAKSQRLHTRHTFEPPPGSAWLAIFSPSQPQYYTFHVY